MRFLNNTPSFVLGYSTPLNVPQEYVSGLSPLCGLAGWRVKAAEKVKRGMVLLFLFQFLLNELCAVSTG